MHTVQEKLHFISEMKAFREIQLVSKFSEISLRKDSYVQKS